MRKKAIPPGRYRAQAPLVFTHNKGSITISRDMAYVSIEGSLEDAAWAMAEELLKRGKTEPTTHWTYPFGTKAVIAATFREGLYEITLLEPDLMDPAKWQEFKKDVEKICNKLTAFM